MAPCNYKSLTEWRLAKLSPVRQSRWGPLHSSAPPLFVACLACSSPVAGAFPKQAIPRCCPLSKTLSPPFRKLSSPAPPCPA